MMMRRRKKRSWWWWRLWWKLSKISGNDGGSLVEVFLPIHVNDYWVVDSCPRIKSLPLPKYFHDHRVIEKMRFLIFQCRLWESSLIPSVTMNTRCSTSPPHPHEIFHMATHTPLLGPPSPKFVFELV